MRSTLLLILGRRSSDSEKSMNIGAQPALLIFESHLCPLLAVCSWESHRTSLSCHSAWGESEKGRASFHALIMATSCCFTVASKEWREAGLRGCEPAKSRRCSALPGFSVPRVKATLSLPMKPPFLLLCFSGGILQNRVGGAGSGISQIKVHIQVLLLLRANGFPSGAPEK